MLNLRSKVFWNFFIYRGLWTLNFSEGVSGYQLFLVMPNLRWKFFRNFLITEHSGLWIFQIGCWGTNFFLVPLNLRSKIFQNFLIYRALLMLNFSQSCLGTNFFWSCWIWGQNFFGIFLLTEHSGLWIIQGRGIWTWTLFGHAKLEVKIFLEFFHLQRTLDSQFFRGGVVAPTFSGNT